jgi:hypothetical protein
MNIWERKDDFTFLGSGSDVDQKGNEFKKYSEEGFFNEDEAIDRADNKSWSIRGLISQNNNDCEVYMHWKGVPVITKEGDKTVITWGLNSYPVI